MMEIHPIPCPSTCQGNYAYLIICPETRDAAVIDPSEFEPVWEALQQHSLQLKAILNTHHHWDHVGGNLALQKRFPGLPVYGHHSDKDRLPGQTHFLHDQDTVSIGKQVATIVHNPGHTDGAISYAFPGTLFTGDTLFSAGCGRMFEGTPEEFYHSLNHILAKFPEETLIYFGHEYTEANLRFALSIDPQHQPTQQRFEEVQRIREKGGFTTPTTLKIEIETNPFLRCQELRNLLNLKDVSSSQQTDLSPVFAALRRLKDQF